MFPPRHKKAFTLLEVVLAVAVLAAVGLSIYQFIDLHLRAIQLSTEHAAQDAAVQAVIRVIQSEMNDQQPPVKGGRPPIVGIPHNFNGGASSDEMTWYTIAGNGMFTRYATGEYWVKLTLRQPDGSSTAELGLWRNAATNPDSAAVWMHLMDGVTGLEISYFDASQPQAGWQNQWNSTTLPSAIKLRIWLGPSDPPYEANIGFTITKLPTS